MKSKNINSIISVVPVNNFKKVNSWYKKLLGREADLQPMEGIAEWEIINNGWVQVTAEPGNKGNTAVIIGVNDVEAQRKTCSDAGVSVGEIIEYPDIIKMIEAVDPEGNKISFVQDISKSAGN